MLSSTRISARTGAAAFSRSLASYSSSTPPQRTTFHLPPSTSVFPYGAVSSQSALFRNIGWTIEHNQSWAVVGTGKSRKGLIEILQAHHRLSPPVPPPGRHPFLDSLPPSSTPPIQHLLFAQAPASGEFQDYTARYGTLFEDDRLTLRQKLQFAVDPGDPLTGGKKGAEEARQAARKVGIEHLLDVPFVGLSNGQTRRARMAVALIRSPRLLIVEEPFAGLDPEGRKEIAEILGGLRDEGVRVVLVLRGGEDVPEWITHVAEATEDSGLRTGVRGDEKAWWEERKGRAWRDDPAKWTTIGADVGAGKQVVKLQSVDVSYGPKKVLEDISWEIKTGSRWHLQGHNGSGKTTLLALILGEHPRSFSLPSDSLELFGRPRRATPTPTLNALIGHTSPEIFKSFPRTSLSVFDAVGTGFEGIFSRRTYTDTQRDNISRLLTTFFPDRSSTLWAEESFASLPPADQSLILFCRAVVHDPELLILDEPFAFMEDDQIARCRSYLKAMGGRTAVIWVGHWIEERPWVEDEGRIIKLEAGKVVYRSEEV